MIVVAVTCENEGLRGTLYCVVTKNAIHSAKSSEANYLRRRRPLLPWRDAHLGYGKNREKLKGRTYTRVYMSNMNSIHLVKERVSDTKVRLDDLPPNRNDWVSGNTYNASVLVTNGNVITLAGTDCTVNDDGLRFHAVRYAREVSTDEDIEQVVSDTEEE